MTKKRIFFSLPVSESRFRPEEAPVTASPVRSRGGVAVFSSRISLKPIFCEKLLKDYFWVKLGFFSSPEECVVLHSALPEVLAAALCGQPVIEKL